jgi:hypothetical protein
MSTKRIVPLVVVLLAAGHKASREGKSHDIATRELFEALPRMGFEINRSAVKGGKSLEKAQPFEPLSVE